MPNEWLYHDNARSTYRLTYKPESESEKSDQIQIDKFKYIKTRFDYFTVPESKLKRFEYENSHRFRMRFRLFPYLLSDFTVLKELKLIRCCRAFVIDLLFK